MKQILWSTAVLVCLATICSLAECRTVVKRETKETHDELDPNLDKFTEEMINRDKRKVEVVKGVKNAVLGFVFNKIDSFIDHKTHWINELDKTNIAKNAAHHIFPPADPVVSLSGIISGVIGQKLQAVGPFLTLVTSKLSGGGHASAHKGLDFGAHFNAGAGTGHGAAI